MDFFVDIFEWVTHCSCGVEQSLDYFFIDHNLEAVQLSCFNENENNSRNFCYSSLFGANPNESANSRVKLLITGDCFVTNSLNNDVFNAEIFKSYYAGHFIWESKTFSIRFCTIQILGEIECFKQQISNLSTLRTKFDAASNWNWFFFQWIYDFSSAGICWSQVTSDGKYFANWNSHELKVLDLSNNLISILPPSIFLSCPKLEVLWLENNWLCELDEKVFVHCNALRVLNLKMDFILKFIHSGNLTNLRQLNITRNRISTAFDETTIIPNLEILNVEENLLNDLQNITSTKFTKLIALGIEYNGIPCDQLKTFLEHWQHLEFIGSSRNQASVLYNGNNCTNERMWISSWLESKF